MAAWIKGRLLSGEDGRPLTTWGLTRYDGDDTWSGEITAPVIGNVTGRTRVVLELADGRCFAIALCPSVSEARRKTDLRFIGIGSPPTSIIPTQLREPR